MKDFNVWYITDKGLKFKTIKAVSKEEAYNIFKQKSRVLVAGVIQNQFNRA